MPKKKDSTAAARQVVADGSLYFFRNIFNPLPPPPPRPFCCSIFLCSLCCLFRLFRWFVRPPTGFFLFWFCPVSIEFSLHIPFFFNGAIPKLVFFCFGSVSISSCWSRSMPRTVLRSRAIEEEKGSLFCGGLMRFFDFDGTKRVVGGGSVAGGWRAFR